MDEKVTSLRETFIERTESIRELVVQQRVHQAAQEFKVNKLIADLAEQSSANFSATEEKFKQIQDSLKVLLGDKK